jgi:LacI family transcriptional regulator
VLFLKFILDVAKMSKTKRKVLQIAILVDTSTAWGRRLANGVSSYLQRHGPWYVWIEDHGQDEKLRLPPGWVGDGVIARVDNIAMARYLVKTKLPVVNVSGMDLPGIDFPRVTNDVYVAGQLAAEHFLDRGFRNFAFVGAARRNYVISRYGAFDKALKKYGFTAARYLPSAEAGPKSDWIVQQRDLARWLAELPKPVAVYTWAVRQPARIIDACRRVELDVPEQVAVLGGDDDELFNRLNAPPVSGLTVPSKQMGYKAAELLHRLIKGQKPPKQPILICPTGIITRQSTDILAIDDVDVQSALHFIRLRATDQICVEDVLREVPISRSVLERRFQTFLGRTPAAEIQRVRLERARLMLAETDMSIPNVATQSGFGSPEYMSFAFKREVGQTPLQYRRYIQGR